MDTTELIIQLSGLIGALGIITTVIKKRLSKELEEIKNTIQNMDYNSCKTYLTDFLTDVENGVKKSNIQNQRACEIYDRYLEMKGNHYINTKWEKLMK